MYTCMTSCMYIDIHMLILTSILCRFTVPSFRNCRRYAYETLVKKIRTGQGQKEDESTLTDKAKEIHHIYVYT